MQHEPIQQAAYDILDQIPLEMENLELRARATARCTPCRRQSSSYLPKRCWLGIHRPKRMRGPRLLVTLLQGWAELTRQGISKLQERLYPKLLPLVKDWRRKTGCPGLTDEAVFRHLIEETPKPIQ